MQERKPDRKSDKARLCWLDFGKAMGILTVLLVHAGCSLGPVTFYGGMFYMPVFFVAAGYTYHMRPEESFAAVLKKRAKRLLLPYVSASLFLWLFFWVKDSLLSGNPQDIKLLSLFGILYSRNQMYTAGYAGENPVLLNVLNAPLWFLTAIFLVYVYYEMISCSGKKYLWLCMGLVSSVLLHYSTNRLFPWSLEAVPYFACFFAFGEALRVQDGIAWLKGHKLWNALVLVNFLLLSRLNGSVNLSCGNYGCSMLAYLLAGSLGSVLVFMAGVLLERVCKPLLRLACLVGQETLLILCFHMFLFMFIRTAAGIVGLPEGLTKTAMVAGSIVVLTGIGRIRKMVR